MKEVLRPAQKAYLALRGREEEVATLAEKVKASAEALRSFESNQLTHSLFDHYDLRYGHNAHDGFLTERRYEKALEDRGALPTSLDLERRAVCDPVGELVDDLGFGASENRLLGIAREGLLYKSGYGTYGFPPLRVLFTNGTSSNDKFDIAALGILGIAAVSSPVVHLFSREAYNYITCAVGVLALVVAALPLVPTQNPFSELADTIEERVKYIQENMSQ